VDDRPTRYATFSAVDPERGHDTPFDADWIDPEADTQVVSLSAARSRKRGSHRLPGSPTGTKRKRSLLVLMAAAVGVVGLPSAGVAAASQCNWMRAAQKLSLALDEGAEGQQAKQLRTALDKAGVGNCLACW